MGGDDGRGGRGAKGGSRMRWERRSTRVNAATCVVLSHLSIGPHICHCPQAVQTLRLLAC